MERIIIIVRDEVGIIAGVARALADRGVNIESLDTERAGEQGIITLTTDDTDTALRALAGAGFPGRHRRLPGLPAPRRARRAGQGGGAVQGRGREHPEPAHPGPPGRAGGGGPQRPRPRGGQKAAGPGVPGLSRRTFDTCGFHAAPDRTESPGRTKRRREMYGNAEEGNSRRTATAEARKLTARAASRL